MSCGIPPKCSCMWLVAYILKYSIPSISFFLAIVTMMSLHDLYPNTKYGIQNVYSFSESYLIAGRCDYGGTSTFPQIKVLVVLAIVVLRKRGKLSVSLTFCVDLGLCRLHPNVFIIIVLWIVFAVFCPSLSSMRDA